MKTLLKKSLAVFMAVAMMMCAVPFTASAESYSGTCGENLTWEYDPSSATLTITGSGAMDGYAHVYGEIPPWADYLRSICFISLPDGLTNIGQGAFQGTQITSLNLPDSVTEIGSEAYRGCNNLKHLIIPNTVTKLGLYSFEKCENLETVSIPASVTNLGYEAFRECHNIKSFSVESTNEYYSSDSYGVLFNKNKTSLLNYPLGNTRTTYRIPDGVTSINNSAFENSKYLTEIYIPYGITLLGNNVFQDCAVLKNIIVPDSVTKIYTQAINYCPNLEFAHIPASVTSIGSNFGGGMSAYICSTTEDCYAKTYADENGIEFRLCTTEHSVDEPTTENPYSNKCGDNITWTFNTETGELKIEGTGTMWNWSGSDDVPWSKHIESIKSVDISGSVTTIGNNAFSTCTKLISIKMPDTVTSIGEYAFGVCENLTYIEIPDSVVRIGNRAFILCDKLTKVEIPYGVTSIGAVAFGMCTSLTELILPDTVTSIGEMALAYCDNLEYIHIPSSVTSIGEDILSDSPAYICSTTEDCIAKTYADKNGIEFRICTGHGIYSGKCGDNLTWTMNPSTGTLTISGTGDMYDYRPANAPWYWLEDEGVVVNDNEDIEKIIIENGVTSIGTDAFYNCINLETVEIPNTLTVIGDYALYACGSLENIVLNNSISKIGDFAFAGCSSLDNITLPNLKVIESYCFQGCKNLSSITIPESVTTIEDSAFRACKSLKEIYIPKSVTSIGDSAFQACDMLVEIMVDANNNYYSNDEYGVLFNKNKTKLIQYPTGNERNSYTVPDSVIEIGHDAFGYTCLVDIYFPQGIKNIGDNAFQFSDKLKNVILPNGIESIGGLSFVGCASLEFVHLPKTVKNIGEYLFNVIGLESIYDYTPAYICSTTEDCYAKTYADENGIEFRICTGHGTEEPPVDEPTTEEPTSAVPPIEEPSTEEPTSSVPPIEEPSTEEPTSSVPPIDEPSTEEPTTQHKHIPQKITVPASCTVNGMEYTVCAECGDPIGDVTIIPAGHKWGDWETVTEATCKTEGKLVKKCSACGATEEETIDKKPHTPGEWETIKEATCKAAGEKVQKCTACGDTLDTEIIPRKAHTPGEWETIKEATCKATGEKVQKCTACGETLDTEIIPKKDHIPGDWITVLEPTIEADGKKIKKCKVCGDVLEEEIIPKLEVSTAVDEKTGVEMDYIVDDYEDDVEISVKESFDGAAFDVIDTSMNSTQKFIYDITMTVGGVVTQPKGKVTIKIPLPAGYDPERTFVYHVNSTTGKLEPMKAKYIEGYMVFETTHFSYYALVEVFDCEMSIKQPSITTINYGDTLILHADIGEAALPEGYSILWTVEGTGVNIRQSEDGFTCEVTSIQKGNVTVKATIVDENGEAVTGVDGNEISATQQLTSKVTFWQKIVSFFKNLFGISRIILQSK